MTESADEGAPRDLFLIEESADERRRRVEQLKGIVEGGRYHIPVGKVADAVVAFYRRPDGWTGIGNSADHGDTC